MANPDLYEILGVHPRAEAADIKAAYRARAKRFHPDGGGDSEHFRLLKLAYDVLSEPGLRHYYDRTGEVPARLWETHGDDPELRRLADELLMEAVRKAGAPQFEDVIEVMRRAALAEMDRLDQLLEADGQLVDKAAMVAGRIRVARGENVLRSLLAERQEELRHEMQEARHRRDLHERLLSFLEAYSYELYADSVSYASRLHTREGPG